MKKNRIAAILLAVTLLALSFTACAASSKFAQNATSADAFMVAETAPAEEPMAEPEAPMDQFVEAEEAQYDSALSATTAVTEDGVPEASTADAASKIIYSANLQAQTTEFDAAIAALDKQIADFGGFIERSDIRGDTCYNNDGTTTVINRWANYTIRVPASKFEAFLRQTEGLGNITSVSRYAENVTSQYTDYEARLSSLRTQEERLLDMLSKSEDVETLIALEQRLSDVRYEIESIERSLRNYDMQIKYSTVDLDLREVEIYTPTVPVRRTFSQKLSDSFSDGWTGFTRSIQNVILGLAAALPALVLLAVIVIVVIVLVKRARKKRKEKFAAQQEPPQEPKQ